VSSHWPSRSEGVPDPAQLGIHVSDHPVVLGAHRAERALVGRSRRFRQAERRLMKPMAMRRWGDGHVDLIGVEGDCPAARGGVRRMRSQVAQVGEPRAVLSLEPVQVTGREESGHADVLRPSWLGRQCLVTSPSPRRSRGPGATRSISRARR